MDGHAGAVRILFLNAGGTLEESQKISSLEGDFGGFLIDEEWFGWSLARLGDLDGDARYLARADDVGLAWLRAPILRAAQVLGQFAGSRDSARRLGAEFHDADGRS